MRLWRLLAQRLHNLPLWRRTERQRWRPTHSGHGCKHRGLLVRAASSSSGLVSCSREECLTRGRTDGPPAQRQHQPPARPAVHQDVGQLVRPLGDTTRTAYFQHDNNHQPDRTPHSCLSILSATGNPVVTEGAPKRREFSRCRHHTTSTRLAAEKNPWHYGATDHGDHRRAHHQGKLGHSAVS